MQPVEPGDQSSSSSSKNETTPGCNLASFDCSSSLLATRIEEAPGAVWVWDIPTSELRAVLLYHAKVAAVQWHPSQPELLLVRCEGAGGGFGYVWDPISQGPRAIDTAAHWQATGKLQAGWLGGSEAEAAASVFCSDSSSCMVASLAEAEAPDLPIPAAGKGPTALAASPSVDGDSSSDGGQLDDTFHFKKFATS